MGITLPVRLALTERHLHTCGYCAGEPRDESGTIYQCSQEEEGMPYAGWNALSLSSQSGWEDRGQSYQESKCRKLHRYSSCLQPSQRQSLATQKAGSDGWVTLRADTSLYSPLLSHRFTFTLALWLYPDSKGESQRLSSCTSGAVFGSDHSVSPQSCTSIPPSTRRKASKW